MGDAEPRVVVGGGAAGLMAAIAAGEAGGPVILLEGARRPGAKILVSGGTRCNVTNVEVTERDFAGGSPAAIRKVLRGFPAAAARRFFEESGVALKAEASGKLFPRSDRARDVLDALLRRAERAGVELRTGCRVAAVERRAGGGFRLRFDGLPPLDASRLLLATGGLSMPKTGSDGAGLRFAARLGHTLVPTTPALAPLLLAPAFPHAAMAGASLPVQLALRIDGKVARRVDGPLLWTHFGASGPAALDLSRHLARARLDGLEASLELSMLPGEDVSSVDGALVAAAAAHPTRSVARWLDERLPPSVAAVVAQQLCDLDPTTRLGALARETRRGLARALVEAPLPVTGDRGYAVAEATAGGVALGEVSPATMESRVVPGLFLAGEMLDVDGRLGGFNFQWAWSSGQAAGRGLARG